MILAPPKKSSLCRRSLSGNDPVATLNVAPSNVAKRLECAGLPELFLGLSRYRRWFSKPSPNGIRDGRCRTTSLSSGDHKSRSDRLLMGNQLVAGLGSQWVRVRGFLPWEKVGMRGNRTRRTAWFRLTGVFLLLCTIETATQAAPVLPPEAASTRSLSGQFIIHERRPQGSSEQATVLSSDPHFASFDPMVLAVSCERLKQDLWRELGISGSHKDKVHIVLRAARSAEDGITITTEHFRDGWQYRVDLPDVTDRICYLRAMTEVVLLEFANRGAESRSAELPAWLIEGLAQHLLVSEGTEIIVPPPRRSINGLVLTMVSTNSVRVPPMDYARVQLRNREQLSFQALSWPADRAANSPKDETYRLSAQLFVTKLLELQDGRQRMREMLSLLPHHFNWQIAFLRAFRADFGRLLDVEKWWTLQWLHFTALEPSQTWPVEESWRKLEQALRPPTETRAGTNDLPVQTETTLQTIVTSWDRNAQNRTLKGKILELDLMRPRLSPALVPIADDYRRTLQGYLEQSSKSRSMLTLRKQETLRQAKTSAVESLNQLDARRSSTRPRTEPLASTRSAVPLEPLP